jgi:hypothetical protein
MFRRRSCAIFRELKVPDEICLRYVMGAEIVKVDVEYRVSGQLKIPSVKITYFISNFDLPEDGACTVPKHVGATLTFRNRASYI